MSQVIAITIPDDIETISLPEFPSNAHVSASRYSSFDTEEPPAYSPSTVPPYIMTIRADQYYYTVPDYTFATETVVRSQLGRSVNGARSCSKSDKVFTILLLLTIGALVLTDLIVSVQSVLLSGPAVTSNAQKLPGINEGIPFKVWGEAAKPISQMSLYFDGALTGLEGPQ
ncbi:hypothetical protein MMC13_004054 [Lambiella insularis]|nr:hypothetical protein [Lambiella insularis]